MAAETKVSVVKVKPEGTSLKDGGKHVVSQKRKIESSSSKQIRDKKSSISTNVVKSEVKETMASSSKSATKTTTVKVKSQKKVFTLPGQRYDPPEEREPLRIFYESLSEQLPSSQMAEFCIGNVN
ncbi:hypothetical protein GIB67_025313 [Kingdonia uniflora]|uniref:Uncharacterized protein n=1 Tax=Kingdonia uniflora TaxID=39325 RepID=A0A7J7NBG8_9MAGN|nr:hypothetical protein GIB67_025313 [Kingdonia uniflora]